jgi:methylisocitrate lyase
VKKNQPQRLRRLLEGDRIVASPAIYDCLTAKLGEQAGFEMLFTSGFGMSASLLGRPDLGLLTASEVLDRVRYICRAVDVPVIADLDTGYGNVLNVTRTVEEAVDANAAGIILEDQEWPKRCGHFDGKRVIPVREHVEKIRAAVRARSDSELVIVARTDARATLGLDAAIERGRAYADAGADVIFIEAPQSEGELERIAEAFPDVWLFANIIEGGKTPAVSVTRLQEMGYTLVAFALSGLFAAAKGVMTLFRTLKENGSSMGRLEGFSFKAFADVIGLPAHEALLRALTDDEAS